MPHVRFSNESFTPSYPPKNARPQREKRDKLGDDEANNANLSRVDPTNSDEMQRNPTHSATLHEAPFYLSGHCANCRAPVGTLHNRFEQVDTYYLHWEENLRITLQPAGEPKRAQIEALGEDW